MKNVKFIEDKPFHDHNSHFADSMRYLCLSLSLSRDIQSTPEEIDRRYREAAAGYDDGMGEQVDFLERDQEVFRYIT